MNWKIKQEYESIILKIQENAQKHKQKIIWDFSQIEKSLELFIKNQEKNFSSLSKKEDYFYFLQEIENIKYEFNELENIQKNIQEYTNIKFAEKDFRVVIFWKTNVWKSTLREALTKWDGKSIWIGKQWTTTDFYEYNWGPLQIVDIPWIWESDGNWDLWTKHAQIALKQAQYSDLLLFLISDDTSWIDFIIDYVKDNLVQLWKKIIFVINHQKTIDFDLLDNLWLEKYLDLECNENKIDEVKSFYTQRFQEKWLYFDYDFEIINAEAGFLSVTENKNYHIKIYQERFFEKRKELAIISNLEKLENKILNEFIQYWEQIRVSWYYQFYIKQLEKTNEIIEKLYLSFLQRRWYLEVELQKFEKFFENWEKWILSDIQEIVETQFDDLFKEVEEIIHIWESKEEIENYLKNYISNSSLKESLDGIFLEYQESLTKKINTINQNFQQKATFIDEKIFGNIKLSKWIIINWDFWDDILSIWIKSVLTLWWAALWSKLWSILWAKWAMIWSIIWSFIGAFLSSEISDWIKDNSKIKKIENKKTLKENIQKQANEIIQKIQSDISKNTDKIKSDVFSKFKNYLDLLDTIICSNKNRKYKIKITSDKKENNIDYNYITKDVNIKIHNFVLFKSHFYEILSSIYLDDFPEVEKFFHFFIHNSILWISQNLDWRLFYINKNLCQYLLSQFDVKVINYENKKEEIYLYLIWKSKKDIEKYINKFFSQNIKCYFFQEIDENILEYKNKKYLYFPKNNYFFPQNFDKIEKKEDYFIVYQKEKYNFVLHNWFLVSDESFSFTHMYNTVKNNWIISIIDKEKNILNTHCIKVNDNLYYEWKNKKYISFKTDILQYFDFKSLEKYWEYFIAKEEEKYYILGRNLEFILDDYFDKIEIVNDKYLQIYKNWKINFLQTGTFNYIFNDYFDTAKKSNDNYIQIEQKGEINFLYSDTLKYKFEIGFSALWKIKKDFFWVKIWEKYNILNKKYDFIFNETFDSIFPFWEKYFVIKIWNNSNILDENMNLFFEENIEYISKIQDSWYAKIQKNWKINFLHSQNLTYKYDFWFDSIWDFWEKYYKAEWNYTTYILDKNYNLLQDFVFQYISKIEKLWYIKVKKDKKYNFLNPKKLIFKYDFWFDNIWKFWEKYYKTERWWIFYFFDENYNLIKETSWYHKIWYLKDNKAVIENIFWENNIIDNNLNLLFDSLEILWSKSPYFAKILKNGKYNFLDNQYNEVFLERFHFDKNNCAILHNRNGYFLINHLWNKIYNWYFDDIKILNRQTYEVWVWKQKYYLYLDGKIEEKTFLKMLI